MIESKVVMSEEVEKDEYPKMMIDGDGLIVLFVNERHGTIVDTGDDKWRKIGEYDTGWSSDFKPFHGTVTLTSK